MLGTSVMRRKEAIAGLLFVAPVTMKKGRPATIVSAIVPTNRRADIERTLILETTTLGVRVSPLERTKAGRAFASVTTRWGDVQLKLRGWDGRVIGAMPEYDDCLRLSEARGVPIREVWAETNRLGEVYIGQHWQNVTDKLDREPVSPGSRAEQPG